MRFELIEEALVRRIRDSERNQGIFEAWEALLNVQRQRKQAEDELKHVSGVHAGLRPTQDSDKQK